MNSLSIREKNLLLGALLLLVVSLGYIFAIQPIYDKYHQGQIQLQTKLQTLSLLQTSRQQLGQGKSIQQIKTELETLDTKLPSRPDTAELVYFLKEAAIKNGAVLVGYKADEGKDAAIQGLKALPLTVSFTGSYPAIQGAIGELEKFPRAVWIQQGIINKPTQTGESLTATLQLDVYYLPQDRPYADNVVPKVSPAGKTNPF